MSGFWRDFRCAARGLGKNPGVTAIMVFTLALAIGATTAIFSVVYGVLLRPLPYSAADRIMAVSEVNSNGRPSRLADPNFDDFRDQNHSFQSIAKNSAYPVPVSGASQPTRPTVAAVTPGFFTVFGAQPTIGRDFTASDDQKGAAPVALVSYGYWRQYLGSAQDLSQSHLKINNAIYSVIGVLPSGFRFPSDVDVWLAADIDGETLSRTTHNYSAVGRLKDDVSVDQARQDISAIARRIYQASNEKNDSLLRDGRVVPLQDSITGTVRSPLLILLGAVGFLLLVACANVANLLLAQASVRERELSIRIALGVARGRLVRQFLTEAFLLSLIGGALGVLAALGGRRRIGGHGSRQFAAARQRFRKRAGAALCVLTLHGGGCRARRLYGCTGNARRFDEGPWRGRARTGRIARQPARRASHCRGANRHHVSAGDRRGFAGTQLNESPRGESRISRGQDRSDGRLVALDVRLAALGGRSQSKIGSAHFLFELDEPPQTNPRRARRGSRKRAAHDWRTARRNVCADDAE